MPNEFNFGTSIDELMAEPEVTTISQPEPASPPATIGEGGEDFGITDYATDALRGVGNGIADFGMSVYGLADDAANAIGFDLPGDVDNVDPLFGEQTTMLGEAINGITQFAAGFGATFLIPGLGAGAVGASAARTVGMGLARGAVADFISFDEHEERFSDLIQSVPALQNPITEYLASNADDGFLEGRLKNAVEGLGLGVAGEFIFKAVKTLKGARAAKATGAADEEVNKIITEALSGDVDAVSKLTPEMLKATEKQGVTIVEGGEGIRVIRVNADSLKTSTPTFEIVTRDGATTLDDEAFIRRQLREGHSPDSIVNTFTSAFNTRKLGLVSDEVDAMSAVKAVNHIAERVAKFTEEEVGGVITLERAAKEAGDTYQMYGLRPEKMLKDVTKDAKAVHNMGIRMIAYRMYLSGSAKEVGQSLIRQLDLQKQIRNGIVDDKFVNRAAMEVEINSISEQVGRRFAEWSIMLPSMRKVQTEMARGPSFGRIGVDSVEAMNDIVATVGKNLSGDTIHAKALAKQLMAAADDPKAMMRLGKAMRGGKLISIHHEYWINALLSGVKTHVVNLSSTAANTLLKPGEIILGGAIMRDGKRMTDGMRLYQGVAMNFTEGFKATAKVLRGASGAEKPSWIKGGQPILDPITSKVDIPKRVITGDNLVNDKIGFMKPAIDVLGALVTMPTRALAAGDEFFKTINYRSFVTMDAMRRAIDDPNVYLKEGLTQDQYVKKAMSDAYAPDGSALHPDTLQPLQPRALQYARESTWTNDLPDGSMGQDISNFVNKHPSMTLLVPFVRTPLNIFKTVWDHTPGINLLHKEYRKKMWSPDKLQRAEARGQMAVGIAASGSFFMLAQSGRLTGAGPQNPKQRDLLKATGWQPYSIVSEDADGNKRYHSYQRIEPFGSIIAVMADAAEVFMQLDPSDQRSLPGALAGSVASNVVNKTYLVGITNAIEALTDPDRNLERWLQNQTASYIPRIAGTFNNDPHVREINDFLDRAKARIPGYSKTLPPRRNIFGEPINVPMGAVPFVANSNPASYMLSPFAYSKDLSDGVKDELASLGHSFAAKSDKVGNVELRQFVNKDGQQAYDRMREIVSEKKLGGLTMKERLSKLIGSEGYQRLPKFVSAEFESQRVTHVQRVISQFYEAAYRQTLKEYPELKQAVLDDRRNGFIAKRGGLAAIPGVDDEQ